MNDTPTPPEKPKTPVDAPKANTSDSPPTPPAQPGRPETTGAGPKPGTRADVREAVRDAKAAGIKADIEAHPHKVAPDVRSAKGQSGVDAQSAHVAPTSALRDTSGYVRGDALTASLPPDVHRALDRQWQAAFREMASSGKTEITVRELNDVVGKAIQNTPGLTKKQQGTLEWMLDKELTDLGLSSADKVRLPYSGGVAGGRVTPTEGVDTAKAGSTPSADKGRSAASRGDKAAHAAGKAADAERGVKNATGRLADTVGKAGTAAGSALDAAGRLASKALKITGVIGNVLGVAGEVKEEVARTKPELLPEGTRVDLRMQSPSVQFWTVPSGYGVEKTNGQVIYRDSDGKEVTRDQAIKGSPQYKSSSSIEPWA